MIYCIILLVATNFMYLLFFFYKLYCSCLFLKILILYNVSHNQVNLISLKIRVPSKNNRARSLFQPHYVDTREMLTIQRGLSGLFQSPKINKCTGQNLKKMVVNSDADPLTAIILKLGFFIQHDGSPIITSLIKMVNFCKNLIPFPYCFTLQNKDLKMLTGT